CLDRLGRRAERRVRRACGVPGFCGDGILTAPERCDASASSNGGCPDGLECVACLFCDARCGDGRVGGDEVCDPQATASGCAADEACVGRPARGPPVPATSAEEDVAPCAGGVGDRWTFTVEAGTVVTIGVDTVDAASAAKLAVEGACPSPAPGGRAFRAAVGQPCTFTPPNHPNPGYD